MIKYIITISLFIFSLISVESKAQNLEYSWAKKAGGNFTDEGNSITTDLNGNVIVVGTFASDTISFGNITLAKSDSTSNAMFVAKYNSNGVVLWAKMAVTPSEYKSTNGIGVATDIDGNIFVAGDLNSDSLNFDGNWLVFDNAGYSYLAKFDPNGNFLWVRKAFGAYGTAGVTVDSNGDLFLIGKNAISFDGSLVTNDGTGKHFVVKYSNSGDFIWVKFSTFSSASSYGYNAEWDNKAVFTDVDNNVYMAGWSGLDTTFFNDAKTIYVANNASLRNSFLVKYNSNGIALWAKGADKTAIPASLSNITPEAIYTSNNFVYLAGWWNGDSLRFDNNQITAPDNQNMFVAKFDLLGNNIWTKSLGSEGNDYGNGLALDDNEHIYLIGTTGGYDIHFNNTTVATTIGGLHAAIFKIDSDGNFLEMKIPDNIPFYGTSYGNAIVIDASDNVFISGGFSSGVGFGEDTLTSTNLFQDVFISKLINDVAVGTITPDATQNNFKIYPNPSGDFIFLDVQKEIDNIEIEVNIYSLTGNLVMKKIFQNNPTKIDIEGLVNGIYFITVNSNISFKSQKLIIQR